MFASNPTNIYLIHSAGIKGEFLQVIHFNTATFLLNDLMCSCHGSLLSAGYQKPNFSLYMLQAKIYVIQCRPNHKMTANKYWGGTICSYKLTWSRPLLSSYKMSNLV